MSHERNDLRTLDDLLKDHVHSTTDDVDEYLKEKWLLAAIRTLVKSRIQAGLTQRQVAETLGTTQSAIARLEAGNDIKLSRLWDYLHACGHVPSDIASLPLISTSAHEEAIASRDDRESAVSDELLATAVRAGRS